METISEYIVGLDTYEDNTSLRRVHKYIDWTENHNNPNVSVWALLCAVVLLMINVVGKQMKNDYLEEYEFRKIIESFYKMKLRDIDR